MRHYIHVYIHTNIYILILEVFSNLNESVFLYIWTRLPREVVDAPCLEMFKVRLDGALSNLVELKMSLLIAGGVDQMTFKDSF